MKRHDREYAALIHTLAHRHTGTLLELLAPIYLGPDKITDEDLPSRLNELHQRLDAIFTTPPNEILQELRAAGIQSDKQLKVAVAEVFLTVMRELDPTRPRS